MSMIGANGNTISGFANFFTIAVQSTIATQELFDKQSGKYELTDSSGSVVASLVFKDLDGVTPTAHQSGGTVSITTNLTGALPITLHPSKLVRLIRAAAVRATMAVAAGQGGSSC